jgi:hypothetical protein
MTRRNYGLALVSGAFVGALALGGFVTQAKADTVDATLSATYYEVLNGTGAPDFGGSGSPNVALGSALGPNGLPVVSTSSPGVSLFDPSTHELTWWSPSMNPAVIATGTGTISLPYGSNMFPVNSTGGSDGTAFETAVFSGKFSLASSAIVSFSLGSDDDSFIYVDGSLIGQNPGIHGVTDVDFDSPTLAAGAHTISVFYADREETGAFLSLNLLSSGVTITPSVPEPQSWGLLLLGLGLVGAMRRRRNGGTRD